MRSGAARARPRAGKAYPWHWAAYVKLQDGISEFGPASESHQFSQAMNRVVRGLAGAEAYENGVHLSCNFPREQLRSHRTEVEQMPAAAIPPRPTHDQIVDMFVEDTGGDARAALSNALNINRRLMIELGELAGRRADDRLRAA